MEPAVDEAALAGLKFSECLPAEMARAILRSRLVDAQGIRSILALPIRVVTA